MYGLRKDCLIAGAEYMEAPDADKKRINSWLMDECLAFGDKEVAEKSIRMHLQYEACNLWHYHKFRIYFALCNVYADIRVLEILAQRHETLHFYTQQGIFSKTDALPSNVRLFYRPAPKVGINLPVLLRFAWLSFWRILLSLRFHTGLDAIRHLVLSRPMDEVPMTLPGKDLKIEPENYYYGYILRSLPAEFGLIEEIGHPKLRDASPYPMPRRLFRPRKDIRPILGDVIFYRSLIKRKNRKFVNQAQQNLKKVYALLEAELDQPFEKLVLHLIKSYRGSTGYYLAKYYAFLSFFRKHRFQSLTAVDENSPAIKCIVDAARSEGIRTLAVQHGTIHDLHMAYRYTKGDVAEARPFPDLTLVWGTHWYEILHNGGNYPPSNLALIGQPRTDIIPFLHTLKKNEVHPDIDPNKWLVVFASQPLRDPLVRRRIAEDVFAVAGRRPEWQLLVKLHPHEHDLAYYQEIAAEMGCRNPLLIHQVDLYRLLSVCDVLVTANSTVGAEAIYFHKPLVTLDHLAQDMMGYHRAGVAFQAVDRQAYEAFLVQLYRGGITPDSDAYQRFIEAYAFQIDGKVTERYLKHVLGSV